MMTRRNMTGIKFCGLTRMQDIEWANRLAPEFIGFVFAPASRRYVTFEWAAQLRMRLDPGIKAVGVFVNEDVDTVIDLLETGVIDLAQLHGSEDDEYIEMLRYVTGRPVIKAFIIRGEEDAAAAQRSAADFVLLDSGAGTGMVLDRELIKNIKRPCFLAGGLDVGNVAEAIAAVHPFAVDVSSGIETGGVKDSEKMAAFAAAVRKDIRT